MLPPPQGPKRRRVRDSPEVTRWGPERTEGQCHSHQHWCAWGGGTRPWNLAAECGQRSLRDLVSASHPCRVVHLRLFRANLRKPSC